jgi:hypothetical protein
VRHGHELGKRWSTKDGVVSTLEVHDHEVDVVGAEVVRSAKLHRECDLPERYRALSGKDAPKLCIIRFEVSLSEFKSRQAAAKQDVGGAAPVDEHPLEPDTIDVGVEDEGEMTRFQNCRPSVCSAEGDFTVGLGQESGIRDEVIGIDDSQASALQ